MKVQLAFFVANLTFSAKTVDGRRWEQLRFFSLKRESGWKPRERGGKLFFFR